MRGLRIQFVTVSSDSVPAVWDTTLRGRLLDEHLWRFTLSRQVEALSNDVEGMGVAGERVTEQHEPGGVPALTAASITECYRYVLRLTGGDTHLAEDLTQQVCEAAASRTIDGSEPITRGWMITAARRRFVDHLRRDYRDRRRDQQLAVVAATYDEPDWDAVAGGDALDCLALLAPDHRAALVFRYLDDLSTAEVAELLDRSIAATESLLARARRELARHVEERRHG